MDAIENRNYSVLCRVTGKPAPVVTWLKNGAPVRDNPGTYILTDQSGRVAEAISTFRLSPARRNDNGAYGCEARNLYGRDVKIVRLNLLCKFIVKFIKIPKLFTLNCPKKFLF